MAFLDKHEILERNATLLMVGALAVVTIGGIVEIAPLFYLENTIEKVEGPEAKAVQEAWTKIDVPQCGWCQSGQVMSATALLRMNRAPTDEDIDNAMSGNICRCATYVRIRRAIHDAAETLEG